MTPEDFTRAFAYAFADQDAAGLADLVARDGTVHSLTGTWAEGREAARLAFATEFSGLFAHARLVTGKGSTLPLGPHTALLRQRFVVTGAVDETGGEMPRFGAMMVALLQADDVSWRATSLTISLLA